MDQGPTALRHRLLNYDHCYPSIPVPLITLALQLKHIDRINARSWTLAEQLISQDSKIKVRSTQYHVLAPDGDVPTTLCLQHCPTPAHKLYQAARQSIEAFEPINIVELDAVLRQRTDYPFPNTCYRQWLLARLNELYNDIFVYDGKIALR